MTSLKERIDKELLEIESPSGFKMVYKTELLKIIEEYEKEVESKLDEALHEFPPVYGNPNENGITSTELGYLRGIEQSISSSLLAQIPGKELRCVKAVSGKGIEVGDRCKLYEGYYVPIVRYFSESGEKRPFNPIKIEDSQGFEFI